MKQIVMVMLLLVSCITNAQVLCLRAGKTLLPADYASLRYTQQTNRPFQWTLGAYYERSHRNQLHYSVIGVETMTEFSSNKDADTDQRFGLSSAIGLCWQVEREPWLYKDWSFSKRSSFGIAGEILGDWYLTEAFTLRSFLQQKILFNPHLGRYRLVAGLGIRYRLDHY
jgi:hypothetical protein